MNDWFNAGQIANFPESECVFLEGTPLGDLIVIQQKGVFHALRGICSHEYYELDGVPVQDGQITCPLHLSAFDITTGEALNPPAEESLAVFQVKVEKNHVLIKSK